MHCKNCKIPLTDTSDYCNICGAKIIRNRLTIKNLFEHFSEEFLNYDNKLLKTFIHLFTKPDAVIGSYINGTRKKYVNVISYFAISITIAGLQIFIFKKFYPEQFNFDAFSTPGSQELMTKIMNLTLDYQAIAMMINIPIYAVLCKLTFFKNKTFNYTEILIMFMYIYAQTTIVSVIISIVGGVSGLSLGSVSMLLIPFLFIYSGYCLMKLYGLSLKGIFIKTLLFLVVLTIIYILFILLFVGIMYATGNMEFFQQIIEAQSTAREATLG